MTKPIRYTLGKQDRLKSRKLIGQLFDKGKSVTLFPFRLIYQLQPITGKSNVQAGFSVPSKTFKKAVARNRIKRLTKEAYRLQKHLLSEQLTTADQQLTLFFIYTGKEIPEQALVTEKVQLLLKKLSAQIGKASA